jgi:hypothetical protein
MKRITLILALAALILVGCGRDDQPQPTVTTPDVDENVKSALFDRIDADSFFLVANLEPLPEELSDRFWSIMESVADGNREAYETLGRDADHPLVAALLDELLAIDGRDAFEARGLDGNGLWALHGLSLYPVLHWQLKDAEAFGATLERVAGNAGIELPWRGIDNEQVLWMELDEFGLALHYDDELLSMAVVPDDMSFLRRVANLDQPTRSYDPGDLARFNRERDFLPQSSGFVDFARLVDRLLDGDDELAMPARVAAGAQALAEDPACGAEMRALVERFPRLSTGYRHLTSNEFATTLRIETDRNLGERLARIADSPVRLEGDPDALFSGGLAFNLVAARDFARETVAGWVDNPPECELFSDIRDNAAEWQIAVNRPIPPMVTNLQGLRMSLERIEYGEGMMNVTDASGSLAVFMRNPQMIIGMAQMFSPELAALPLEPGGEPQALPPGMVPNMPDVPAWIAMGDNSIGLAFGEEQKDRINRLLEPGRAGSAILVFGVDFAAYGQMMQDMMERTRAQLRDMDADFDLPDDEDPFAMLGEIYDYSEFSVHLKSEGIEFNSLMRLHD